MIKKYSLLACLLLLVCLGSAWAQNPLNSDSTGIAEPSMGMKAIPVDSIGYAKAYRKEALQFKWGLRGGISQGRINSTEGQIVRVTANGTPLLSNDRIVRDALLANSGLSFGFSAGAFLRVISGSFYLQPEIAYTQKGGRFDFLDNSGNLLNRVDAKFNTIDIPILFGIRYRKARIFVGPVISIANALKEDFSNSLQPYTIDPLDSDFFEAPIMNGMVGLGLEFGIFFVDARYESGFGRYVDRKLGPGSNTTPFNFTADTFSLSIGFLR